MGPSPCWHGSGDGAGNCCVAYGLGAGVAFDGSSEARSSAAISQVAQARQLTDMPVSIVMAQIRGATSNLGISKTWSSQPGMIRVFGTEAGAVAGRSKLHSAWRLYSSDKMSEDGATFSAAGEVASLATWQGDPAHFTDINEPVTRLDPGGNIHRVFPVLDARALKAAAAESEKLEGFGVSVGGAPAATADHPFPMPVRWLYVLQDGRVVAPSGGTGGSATFNSAEVTSSNPVVGRIAFWTDDESCKININTASEGTGWNMPRSTSWSDRNFAYFPPAQNEFQRFPGHPAMVSLSPVLQAFDPKYAYQFPEVQIDGTVSNKTSYQDWLRGIYSLLPRVQLGDAGQGSMGGTIVPSDAGIPLKRERLFASLDEMFYGSAFAGGQRRPNAAGGALDATDLEMGRFFMTAHSRAPEVNLYNRPRVSLWPLQVDKSKRTAKDKLIAYCSTYGKQLGGFQRVSTWQSNAAQGSSQGPTQDFQLEENQKIFGYLQKLTRAPVPGFGIETFDTKYGSLNRNQILLQMFDLVRWGVNGNNAFEPPVYHYLPPGVYTGAGSSATAEASAVPVVAEGTAAEGFGKKLKAFGRYPSIVEASIIFMATDVELKTDGSPVDVVAPLNQADKTNRMRAFLVLQPFTPVVGTPPFTPNVRFRIKGLEQWKVNGQNLGFPADAVNRVWTTSSVTGDRGQTTAYTFLNNQFYKDGAAKTMVPGGTGADESTSFPFVSLEMDVSTADSFTFTGGPITIEMHLGAGPPEHWTNQLWCNRPPWTFPIRLAPGLFLRCGLALTPCHPTTHGAMPKRTWIYNAASPREGGRLNI
ncbi:Verru_Chthon cassette protein A [Verrucomicrobium spinosum]|uniref:Verru_Chthon cassette protein A n=1 Tax=Verrucomicrobium spinosum TaxID=2736 RepID=UPI00277D0ABB|nr:Verru_Chthon cassette protein A [Verrucomicrobium spinosum]